MKKLVWLIVVSVAVSMMMVIAAIVLIWQYVRPSPQPANISPGVAFQSAGDSTTKADLAKVINESPNRVMSRPGLAGAIGGVRVKITSSEPQEVILPIPQLADGQAPICFVVSSTPPDAVTEMRFRRREDSNVVVGIRFKGEKQEVQIAWSAVVLLAPHSVTTNTTPADPYRSATACVQSQADEIVKLAASLWPASGKPDEFAANIQRHIRESRRKQQPRSLDALGILQCGENSICTANSNLAAALMRAKGIACRSVAVIPPTGQRLEMHRIVEYFDKDRWIAFDPSSLQTDVPAKPWQNIVMAKTTIFDEQTAMKPRMGSMIGCPYGQEIELLSTGVTLWGQDFFWTQAKPLAEFEPTEQAIQAAIEAWNRTLESGMVSAGQIKASAAKDSSQLIESLRAR